MQVDSLSCTDVSFSQCQPLINTPIWIEMRVKNLDTIMKRFDKYKLQSLEYLGYDMERAKSEHFKRITYQQESYEPLENDPYAYCIVENGDGNDKRYLVNNIRGYLPTTIISFLMNLHPEARPIYFSRHGQSQYNIEERIGGDSSLTEYGLQYARKLGKRVSDIAELPSDRLVVWTSCLRRTQETAQFIRCKHRVRWQALNEISSGVCEDITYKQMEAQYPDLVELRRRDKLMFRYPQ